MFVEIFEESMRSASLGAQDRVSACKLAGQTLLCLKGHMDEVGRTASFCRDKTLTFFLC